MFLLTIPKAKPGIKNKIAIIGTSESINGDCTIWSIKFPSVPLRGAFGGKTSNAVKIRPIASQTPAQISPFFSVDVNCCKPSSGVALATSSSAYFPVYVPRRGVTIRSVTHVPTAVNKKTEAAIKNQFIARIKHSAYVALIDSADRKSVV